MLPESTTPIAKIDLTKPIPDSPHFKNSKFVMSDAERKALEYCLAHPEEELLNLGLKYAFPDQDTTCQTRDQGYSQLPLADGLKQ